MILKVNGLPGLCLGILHVCGDDPGFISRIRSDYWYSPRMWRWSFLYCLTPIACKVFSTYVEMILCPLIKGFKPSSILHVCGDDPTRNLEWRKKKMVFSTYVEMILFGNTAVNIVNSILHVCGDDPKSYFCSEECRRVFSTYVEMIPIEYRTWTTNYSILHVCGDDPVSLLYHNNVFGYSPRMWRWSFCIDLSNSKCSVFSTYVEMILRHRFY